MRDHFRAELDYQTKMARFLENHDEPRAAATFSSVTSGGLAAVCKLLIFRSPILCRPDLGAPEPLILAVFEGGLDCDQ